MINYIYKLVTKNKLVVVTFAIVALLTSLIAIYEFVLPPDKKPRYADRELVNDIKDCIGGNKEVIVYTVVNQSPKSDSESTETVEFGSQIAERIVTQGYTVSAFNRRYEDLAPIFDGIRVWSSTNSPAAEIYIGKNSEAGKHVECVPVPVKIGFDALDVGTKFFDRSKNQYVIEGIPKIGEDSSTSSKTFYWGIATPPNSEPHPAAGVY